MVLEIKNRNISCEEMWIMENYLMLSQRVMRLVDQDGGLDTPTSVRDREVLWNVWERKFSLGRTA